MLPLQVFPLANAKDSSTSLVPQPHRLLRNLSGHPNATVGMAAFDHTHHASLAACVGAPREVAKRTVGLRNLTAPAVGRHLSNWRRSPSEPDSFHMLAFSDSSQARNDNGASMCQKLKPVENR